MNTNVNPNLLSENKRKSMIQKLKKSVMKIKCFKWLFILISMFFLMQSCSSDSSSVAADLNIISMATIMNADTWPISELSEEETLLVDSISKLDQYKDYAKATLELVDKLQPLIESWNKELLIEQVSKKEAIKTFVTKLNNDKDIQCEWNTYLKSYKVFMNLIENVDLTDSARKELVMKALTNSESAKY